jgi:hypothetical protein
MINGDGDFIYGGTQKMITLENRFTKVVVLFIEAVRKCLPPEWIYGSGRLKTTASKNGPFIRPASKNWP